MTETVICMPAVNSFRNPEDIEKRHPDWKRVKCPECGTECFETDVARDAMEEFGWKATCTNCAVSKR